MEFCFTPGESSSRRKVTGRSQHNSRDEGAQVEAVRLRAHARQPDAAEFEVIVAGPDSKPRVPAPERDRRSP